MNKLYLFLFSLILTVMLCVGVLSLGVGSAVIPAQDNVNSGKLTEMPTLSLDGVLNGKFMTQFEEYYADAFPFRDKLLDLNVTLNRFYTYSPGEKNELVIEHTGGAEMGGAHLENPDPELPDDPIDPVIPDDPIYPVIPDDPDIPDIPDTPEVPDPPVVEDPPKKPEVDIPDENEVTSAGSIVISGDRAMEVPNMVRNVIDRYAQTVSSLAAALEGEARVFSIVTPNSAQFYSPNSMHTGEHDQKAMIERCYSAMAENVITVDAYTALEYHTDEYLFFRTDHHWTQLGAYYAYRAFCQEAGFTAADLSEYETGTYEGFLGSLYNWTYKYPQSQALKNNPDTLTYYLPLVDTRTTYYMNSSLTNGVRISVIDKNLRSSVSNKYMCYLCGDTPICIIESASEGGTCLILKESYGNAFAPFLTEQYSKVITVDPREFNGSGEPALDIVAFAREQGVDDIIVLNYPFMINTGSYVTMLANLIP